MVGGGRDVIGIGTGHSHLFAPESSLLGRVRPRARSIDLAGDGPVALWCAARPPPTTGIMMIIIIITTTKTIIEEDNTYTARTCTLS